MALKLYCDFDGTYADTIQAICALYNEDFCYYPGFKKINWWEIDTWGFEELSLASREYINEYFNQPRFFKVIHAYPYAMQIMMKLHEAGHEITIVSMGDAPNLIQKEAWVKKSLPFAGFIGCDFAEYKDKSHIDMSDGILMDDSRVNLETSNAKYKILFGDNYPWNDGWNGLRCFNWFADVPEVIGKLEANE